MTFQSSHAPTFQLYVASQSLQRCPTPLPIVASCVERDQLAAGRSASGASTNNYSIHFVKAADCYPKCLIAYRVLLTIPVIVASTKRSFSKLKLLRHYLRSTTQERLNSLLCAPLRRTFFDDIDLDIVIEDNIF
jgi:hypothetical protein